MSLRLKASAIAQTPPAYWGGIWARMAAAAGWVATYDVAIPHTTNSAPMKSAIMAEFLLIKSPPLEAILVEVGRPRLKIGLLTNQVWSYCEWYLYDPWEVLL